MPTLVRLLTVLAVIAGLTFAVMAALIHFVEPRQRVITLDVPLEELAPQIAPVRVDPDIPD